MTWLKKKKKKRFGKFSIITKGICGKCFRQIPHLSNLLVQNMTRNLALRRKQGILLKTDFCMTIDHFTDNQADRPQRLLMDGQKTWQMYSKCRRYKPKMGDKQAYKRIPCNELCWLSITALLNPFAFPVVLRSRENWIAEHISTNKATLLLAANRGDGPGLWQRQHTHVRTW